MLTSYHTYLANSFITVISAANQWFHSLIGPEHMNSKCVYVCAPAFHYRHYYWHLFISKDEAVPRDRFWPMARQKICVGFYRAIPGNRVVFLLRAKRYMFMYEDIQLNNFFIIYTTIKRDFSTERNGRNHAVTAFGYTIQMLPILIHMVYNTYSKLIPKMTSFPSNMIL